MYIYRYIYRYIYVCMYLVWETVPKWNCGQLFFFAFFVYRVFIDNLAHALVLAGERMAEFAHTTSLSPSQPQSDQDEPSDTVSGHAFCVSDDEPVNNFAFIKRIIEVWYFFICRFIFLSLSLSCTTNFLNVCVCLMCICWYLSLPSSVCVEIAYSLI